MTKSVSVVLFWLLRACLILVLFVSILNSSIAGDNSVTAAPLTSTRHIERPIAGESDFNRPDDDSPTAIEYPTCAGYTGLAIGVPYEDIDSGENAGAVNVLHGSSASLSSSGSQFWYQESDGIPGISEDGDRFGHAFASGDFDNDGHDDLAVGSPGEAIGNMEGAGSVRILRGSRYSLTANQEGWNQGSPDIPDEPESGDKFGAALAAGDFDGNGYDDLAMGAPGETVDGAAQAGAVIVLYGSGSGLTASGSQYWDQESVNVPGVSETGDQFGSALAAGDFNGDSYVDLAVGVHAEAIGTVIGAGSVRILYGSASGLIATNEGWNQDRPDVPDTVEAFDMFGETLAVGYFNNDAYADLAISAPGETLGSATLAGAVTILHGSASGLTASGSQQWHQNIAGFPDEAGTLDIFGAALAVGDFDHNGQDDLAIGVPGEMVASASNSGAVDIIYGSADGLIVNGSEHWHQGSSGVIGVPEEGDRFGFALAAGDFDDDNHIDLAIGVPNEGIDSKVEVGSVRILDGSPTGLVGDNQGWNQDSDGVLGEAEMEDRFGWALAAGNWCGEVHYVYLPIVRKDGQ